MHKKVSTSCIRSVSVQLNIYSVAQSCENMPVFASSSTDYLVTDRESHVIPQSSFVRMCLQCIEQLG